ncbi:MAG: hypothetical protein AB2552_21275 [Candidatus Thiodiazotropha endolucinida]
MKETKSEKTAEELTVEQWLAIRLSEGKRIDPETAEVTICRSQILDPYGVDPDLPDECHQVGRLYFARNPDSEIRVCFYDVSEDKRDRLWVRLESE